MMAQSHSEVWQHCQSRPGLKLKLMLKVAVNSVATRVRSAIYRDAKATPNTPPYPPPPQKSSHFTTCSIGVIKKSASFILYLSLIALKYLDPCSSCNPFNSSVFHYHLFVISLHALHRIRMLIFLLLWGLLKCNCSFEQSKLWTPVFGASWHFCYVW